MVWGRMIAVAGCVSLALSGSASAALVPGTPAEDLAQGGFSVLVGADIDRAGAAEVLFTPDGGSRTSVDDVRALHTRAGAWSPLEAAPRPAGFIPYLDDRNVITNGRGGFTAIQEEYLPDGTGRGVRVAVRDQGRWSAPADVWSAPPSGFGSAFGLQGAMNDAGQVLLAIRDDDGIAVVMRSTAGVWSAPRLIAGPGAFRNDPGLTTFAVALDDEGDAVVAWVRRVAGGDVLQAATLEKGAGWARPQTLLASQTPISGVAVAVDAAGNATAVWDHQANVGEPSPTAVGTVETAEHAAGAARWSRPASLTTTARTLGSVAVAVDPAGTAIAAWGTTAPHVLSPPGPLTMAVRNDGRWRRIAAPAGSLCCPFDLRISRQGAILLAAGFPHAIEGIWRRLPGGDWQQLDAGLFDATFAPVRVMGDAGDVVVAWNGETINSPDGPSTQAVEATAFDAPQPPVLKAFRSLPKRSVTGQSVPLLQLALSGRGRALIEVSSVATRRVVGAFFTSGGRRPKDIPLPARVRKDLGPGVYTLSADSGAGPERRVMVRILPVVPRGRSS